MDYVAQVQMQLKMYQFHVPEARYADFVCYFQTQKKVVCYRVYQSNAYWNWLEKRLKLFLASVEVFLNLRPSKRARQRRYLTCTLKLKRSVKFPGTGAPPAVARKKCVGTCRQKYSPSYVGKGTST